MRAVRMIGKVASTLALLAFASGLAGCADTASYPKMSDFSRITQKVLTPAEQQQAVQTMSTTQRAQEQQAVQTIESKKPQSPSDRLAQ